MKRYLIYITIAAVVGVMAMPALAGKGGNGGGAGPAATISFADAARTSGSLQRGGSVRFSVEALRVKDRDLYNLWVENRCWQGGVPVSAEYLPVQYSGYRQGFTDAFTLDSANWAAGDATCRAHVWVFPNPDNVVSGATIDFGVA